MNTKKKYKTPLVDLVKLEECDIVTSSEPRMAGDYTEANDSDSDSWDKLGDLFK